MRTAAIGIVLLLGLTGSSFLHGQVQDEAAVRRTLDHYLAGHATGDGSHMRLAFHPEARLFWVQDGALRQRTSAEYIAGFTGRPAPDEAQRNRRIESVDISGTAASARIVLDYPAVRFVDYMSLLKVDGEWKIVNKIFHREPRS
ncbi:MAG TPA: nuclear transport factor 2 family protein [Gemmatimonadaceae bacterium]|nr:nuclear transport factor 2 family protein [Gemmatimonadaceae bacterium]